MLRSALLALALLAGPASAQTLAVGAPAAGTLDGTAPATYTITLAAGQFVAGAVEQETVDVVVVVTAPDGAEVLRNDGPGLGPEPFQFTTDAAGDYTLAVEPFEGASGRYTAYLTLVEAVATTPEGTVRQMMVNRTGPVPGAVVTVVRPGAPRYVEAFGLANLTHGVPFTAETRSNIGSTSKQFTGFAVALLAERGALSLDDDVRTHIPELPDFGEAVTLRHLLGHTSGYREVYDLLLAAGRPVLDGDVVTADEVIGVVQRQPALQNTPGAEFNYNNTGYILLAEVVARVGGAPFPVWMAENVFEPLGMTRTLVRATPGTVVTNSAQGYRGDTDGWREIPDLGGSPGAGGIYTTAGDLALWMENLMAPRIEAEAVAMIQTEGTLNDGEATGYGLGLLLDEMAGTRRVHHGGADTVHRSAFLAFPDLDAGVVVLTNSPESTDALAVRAVRAFVPDAFEPAGRDVVDVPVTMPDDGEFAFEDALFDDFAGRYALDIAPSFVLTFSRGADGGYLTQATGQDELEIVPTSDSTFVLTAVEAGMTFHRDPDGTVRALTMRQNGASQRATRLGLDPETPRDLADYTGRYWSPELETGYTVAIEDGELVARHVRAGTRTLTPLSGEQYSIQVGVTLEFERDGDAVTGFAVSTDRTRGIEFERVD